MGRMRRRLEPDRMDFRDIPMPQPDNFTQEDLMSLEQEILREKVKYQQQQEMQDEYVPDEPNGSAYEQFTQNQYQPQVPQQQHQPQHFPQQPQMSVPLPPRPPQRPAEDRGPLSILDMIKERPSDKGTFQMSIGGRPVDLHVLEDYITKISPFALRTILRYHNAKTIEEMKGYSRGRPMKMNMGTIMLIMLAIGMGVLGLIVMFYMPEIMNMFQGGFGVAP